MSGDSDHFPGYFPEDIARVSKLMRVSPPDPKAHTDAFGVKVDPAYCPWVTAGTVQTAAPFPSDGYLADGIEYAAAALGLELAQDRAAFTAVELGAGWGPWTSFMGLEASHAGFKTINLVAFEADPERFKFLQQHLTLNGIMTDRFHVDLHESAAWYRNKRLYWPVENAEGMDAGMAAVGGFFRPKRDYRGRELKFREIEGKSIASALAGFELIDFMHIDIQGSEWELIYRTHTFLHSRVRCMFVGTHSRKIEGDLIEFLYKNGWVLLREKPCRFDPRSMAKDLTGKTYQDGGQFWRNEKLSS